MTERNDCTVVVRTRSYHHGLSAGELYITETVTFNIFSCGDGLKKTFEVQLQRKFFIPMNELWLNYLCLDILHGTYSFGDSIFFSPVLAFNIFLFC